MSKPKQSKYSKAVRKLIAERREFPADKFVRQYHPRSDVTRALVGLSKRSATEQQLANRELYRVRGNGAYSVGRNWRKFSQGVGLTSAGRQIVSAGAGAASSMIAGAGRLFGKGAYTTNSLMVGASGSISAGVPMVSGTGDETGAIVVTRREYIGDVYAPAAGLGFSNVTYAINPGVEATFPWLSQIAQNYEEYELQQCVFTFRSTTTDIGSSTTGQCGTLIMATQYNATAVPFTDKNAMMEYSGAMSCKTTESMMHGVECDPAKLTDAGGYIRVGPVPLGQDQKSYDHGILNLAIANVPATNASLALGELWVSYTVVLKVPKFFVARGLGISRDVFVSGGALTSTNCMGTNATLLTGQQNNIGTSLIFGTNTIDIQFPPSYAGVLEIIMHMEGMTATSSPFQSLTTGNLSGQVTAVSDIYASRVDASTSPGWFNISAAAGQYTVSTANIAICVIHVRVSPQVGATSNGVRIVTQASAAPTQSTIDIHEYNAGFSTRALGIGPVASQTDAPILINSGGAVVAP